MDEQFDGRADHPMYDLEHLRSETTIIPRPKLDELSTPAPEKALLAAEPITKEPASAAAPVVDPSQSATDDAPAERTISMAYIVAGCIGMLAVFAACFIAVRYWL